MAAAKHHAPAGRYDFTDRFGGLRGFRQKAVFRTLRAKLYCSPTTTGWVELDELTREHWGEDNVHNRAALYQVICRLRERGVPIESRLVPSGTPTAYRLRKPDDQRENSRPLYRYRTT